MCINTNVSLRNQAQKVNLTKCACYGFPEINSWLKQQKASRDCVTLKYRDRSSASVLVSKPPGLRSPLRVPQPPLGVNQILIVGCLPPSASLCLSGLLEALLYPPYSNKLIIIQNNPPCRPAGKEQPCL